MRFDRKAPVALLLVYCSIIPAGCAGPASRPAPDPGVGQLIDEAVQAEVKEGFFGAVLVRHRGSLVLDKGYGSVRGTEIYPATRFWLASLAKQFTSTAIMKCQEKGWLTLADPISRFIPNAPDDKKAIT